MNGSMLNIEERKEIGGGKARRLRRTGYIPAIVYGRGIEALPSQIKASDLRESLSRHGKNSVFSVEFAAEQDLSVLIKDIQYHPLGKDIVHVDFHKVSLDEKIHSDVPVKLVGVDNIKKGGSVVVHQLNEVTVECLPQDVPPYLAADISGLTPGRSLTASQLKIPEGVTLITEPNSVILSITSGKLELQVEKVDEPAVPEGEEGEVRAKRV